MKIDVYKDGVSYVTDEVSTISVTESNASEDNRIKFVTDLAGVSRGKHESNNPPKRYTMLLKEAAPTHEEVEYSLKQESGYKPTLSPSRPLEFLPIVLGYNYVNLTPGFINIVKVDGCALNPDKGILQMSITDYVNLLGRYSYIKDGKIYTNMRAVLNAGIAYDDVPYNNSEDLKEFKALRAMIPMFVWAQVPNTHTAISKEAQSDRVSENNNYWLPQDLADRIVNYVNNMKQDATKNTISTNMEELFSIIVIANSDIGNNKPESAIITYFLNKPQVVVQNLLKLLGYKQEIYNRAMYYFKYKEVVMTGWNIDPNVWEHLFIERSATDIHKNWTQLETKQFVKCIKDVIDN